MTRLLAILAVLSVALLVIPAGLARAETFDVVSTLDAGAAPPNDDGVCRSPGNGPCTLRAAIEEANGLVGADIINVDPGTYTLVAGQLHIVESVTVNALAGAGGTAIVSSDAFRVLCIAAGSDDVVVDGFTIHGGQSSDTVGSCGDGQGGGIHAEIDTTLDLRNSVIQHNAATPVEGGGGGIFSRGTLLVSDSIVRDNSTTGGPGDNNGGGGIRWGGGATEQFVLSDSSIYGNTATVGGDGSGGGGIYSNGQPLLENVTLSSNRHASSDGLGRGGGGILVKDADGLIRHATFFGNHSDRGGGALAGESTDVENSVFHGNTAPSDPDCPAAVGNSLGGNVSSTNPTCGFGPDDRPGVDPRLGPLAPNGSENGTLTHEILERDSVPPAAVNFPTNCPLTEDQRGLNRSQFGTCDSGAYEFDGRASAQIPDCSPTGVIPLNLDAPPGHRVVGLSYRVGNNPAVFQNDTGESGAPLTPTSVTLDEGRTTLEYWGRWESNGGGSFPEEAGHAVDNVLVDKTRPSVDVENAQGQSIFVITRRARANVTATDLLSGLAQDPSATGVPLDTGARGPATFSRTAADLCQNQASDSFDYRVLAPGLGIRTVLERVSGTVRVRQAGGGSGVRASQKGRPFAPLTEPRELPVRSFIDAKRGTVRLTTARTQREDQIQDGLFAAGVFQVLQSRRVRSRGLTEVRLKGGNFRRCRAAGSKAGPGAAQLRRRVIRRLRGNAQGRFRTRGRHSAATVRGTKWQVIDRCDGTLTKVTRGRVVVRDFRLKKNVVVRAGKSYLARAPG